ncbi:hypothetical protein ACDX78_17225 [Virgibacillus oceani]
MKETLEPINHLTRHGVEIRIDHRFITLGAALTVLSEPVSHEHELVKETRQRLFALREDPSVKWLAEMDQKYIILGLGMQTAQLDDPPNFKVNDPETIPDFIREQFSNPPGKDMSKHLSSFWQKSDLNTLIKNQKTQWRNVVDDIAAIIEKIDLIAFQKNFFGEFPYQPVIIPLANLAPSRIDGMGTANDKETYAICLLAGKRSYKEYRTWEILELMQHEASHPIVDKIWRLNPQIPIKCGDFIEGKYPLKERFKQIYRDVNSRFVESLIQASSWFFIREIRGEEEAEEFLQEVMQRTGDSINPSREYPILKEPCE